jgi:hypothetical protein
METLGVMLGLFGGLSLFFWTLTKTLPELKRAGLLQGPPPKPVRVWQITMPFLDARQVQVNPPPSAPPRRETGDEGSVLAEVQALRRQMEQMQSTGHQFDLSFDAALTRLEERVHRVEIKQMSTAADDTARVRLG